MPPLAASDTFESPQPRQFLRKIGHIISNAPASASLLLLCAL
jgi:hypothetical protein